MSQEFERTASTSSLYSRTNKSSNLIRNRTSTQLIHKMSPRVLMSKGVSKSLEVRVDRATPKDGVLYYRDRDLVEKEIQKQFEKQILKKSEEKNLGSPYLYDNLRCRQRSIVRSRRFLQAQEDQARHERALLNIEHREAIAIDYDRENRRIPFNQKPILRKKPSTFSQQ